MLSGVSQSAARPQYGADIVYSEELIDHKLMTCSRVVDEDSGHAKFLDKSGRQSVMPPNCAAHAHESCACASAVAGVAETKPASSIAHW